MISSSELRKLAKESGEKIYWDERVCEDASLEDIEEDKVRWYLERREEIRKVKKPEKMDRDTLLLNIGAAKKVNSEILEKGFITNRSYQELNDVGKKTAYLELSGLIEKGLLLSTGKGRSVRYVARF